MSSPDFELEPDAIPPDVELVRVVDIPAAPPADAPSEGVYFDNGTDTLQYAGEIQLPAPIPTELVVEISGWDYVYRLSYRNKS